MSLSHLDKLLIDVKVISKIEENGKLKTTGLSTVSLDTNCCLRGFYRTFSGDSRSRAVDTVENVISAVIEISSQLLDSSYLAGKMSLDDAPEIYHKAEKEKICLALKNVARDLHGALKGIRNLCRTYSNDAVISARLEQIVENVENHGKRINKKLAFLKEDQSLKMMEDIPKD